MKRRATLLLAGALALGCGSSGKTSVDVATRVAVTITPTPDRLPFDPRSARIAAASSELGELAGHFIALDVDAAMVPEFRSSFEDALGASFENMARDVRDVKQASPDVFAHAMPRIERVSLRYDATVTRDTTTYDGAHRMLVVRGPARRDALVPRRVLSDALYDLYAEQAKAEFAQVSPDQVPASSRRAYFEFLTGRVRGARTSDPAPKTAAELAASPHAARIGSGVRLGEIARASNDAALAGDVQKWLIGEASWFSGIYAHDAALVRALPQDCLFHRVESAYGRWLLGVQRQAPESDRIALVRAVFVRSFSQDRAANGERAHPPFAWPAIDRFAFGMGLVDEWRASGHKALSTGGGSQAQEFVVCPEVYDGTTQVVAHCEYDFYRYVVERDDVKKRLVQALLERDDPLFTESAFAGVRHVATKPTDELLGMLRAVEAKPSVWRIGLRVLAERADNSTDVLLHQEAQRIWLERPTYRGDVLDLLARFDAYEHGNVDWRGFGDTFGSFATASDLARYLEGGPHSLALLSIVWPALGRDFQRAPVIVPKLDLLLDDKRGGGTHGTSPYNALSKIVSRMCAEKNLADLGAMRAYLERRVATHPGEPYIRLADETSASKCSPAPPPPPPRNSVRLVSSKERLRIIQKAGPPGVDTSWSDQ